MTENKMTGDQKTLVNQYDASVKRFLANRKILAWILKECVEEFKDVPVDIIASHCIEGKPEIAVVAVDQDEMDRKEADSSEIDGMNTEENSIAEGTIYYDIRFKAVVPGTKEPIYLIINIEAQKDENTGYPLLKRAIYYVSRLISAQKKKVFTGSHYEKIQKVYSIWIEMNVAEKYANTITEYCIIEKNIVGNRKDKRENYDLINIITIGLGQKDSIKEKSILRLLNVALSKDTNGTEVSAVLKNEFGISIRGSIGKEINIMCNLGEGIVESVTASVQMDTWFKSAINIMKKFNIGVDEAIESLDIPEEKRSSVKMKIEEELIPA